MKYCLSVTINENSEHAEINLIISTEILILIYTYNCFGFAISMKYVYELLGLNCVIILGMLVQLSPRV